jgi:hypothetical protein
MGVPARRRAGGLSCKRTEPQAGRRMLRSIARGSNVSVAAISRLPRGASDV